MSDGARQLLATANRTGRGAPAMSAAIPGVYIDRQNSLLYFSDGSAWVQVDTSGVYATLGANTFTAVQNINMGATSGADGLVLRGSPLTSAGVRSSPGLVLRGGGYTGGTARDVDYTWGVTVTDPAGADDALVLVRQYNGGPDVSLLAIDEGGNVTALGDSNFAGGYRRDLTFSLSAIAASTTARLNYGGVALSYVAARPGSITALTVAIPAAVTGGTVAVSVYVNGVIVSESTLTLGAGETTERGIFPKDTAGLTFAAGALIDVRYTSTGIGETPAIAASLEIET